MLRLQNEMDVLEHIRVVYTCSFGKRSRSVLTQRYCVGIYFIDSSKYRRCGCSLQNRFARPLTCAASRSRPINSQKVKAA